MQAGEKNREQEMYSFICNDQHLLLHPERAIFWEEQQSLIMSDLHFGKTGHFRKSGIPVPQSIYKEDLQRLVSLIQFFNPNELIIVGDLFHSHENKELDLFKKWRDDLSHISMQLVKGNHDILPEKWYRDAGINVNTGVMKNGNFSFTHDPAENTEELTGFMFTGHIHPGVSVRGMGKQTLHFPCFYFTETYCILPAFSRFTGTASIRPAKEDKVFAIVQNSIMQIA